MTIPIPICLLGTDLVHLTRLRHAWHGFGLRFFERVLTPDELRYCLQGENPEAGRMNDRFFQRVGARIAVKEAVGKALGVGMNGLGWGQGLPWRSVETVSEAQQMPVLKLTGPAHRMAGEQGARLWRVSLSHDGDYAMASVVGLG
ncbi:MAG: holo-ACP synthase [Candidatus Melainabacteria bacterium]